MQRVHVQKEEAGVGAVQALTTKQHIWTDVRGYLCPRF